MPANFYVTGPAHIYIASMTGTGARYLGTSRQPPKYRVRRGFVPVYNDIGGTQIPMDLIYSSQEAFTIIDLNRFDPITLAKIRSMPNTDGSAGVNLFGDIGTLMIAEGAAFSLIIVYPYGTIKPAMKGNIPAGIVFPGTVLEGPDEVDQGTTEHKITCIFHSIPVYAPKTGQMVLGHSALPSLPPAI